MALILWDKWTLEKFPALHITYYSRMFFIAYMLLKNKYMCLQDECNIEIFLSPDLRQCDF